MPKRTTIRDVAEYAGTSYQTVSRVINNQSGVAPETFERVVDAIQALNYQPRGASATIWHSTRRLSVIALVVEKEFPQLLKTPFVLEFIEGVEREAAAHGYQILMCTSNTPNETNMQSVYRPLLDNRLADGVIIVGGESQENIRALVEKDYPIVLRGDFLNDLPQVRPDDTNGAFVAMQHLIALDHRKIGLIQGLHSVNSTARRNNGLMTALASTDIDFETLPTFEGDFTVRSGYEGAKTLLTLHPDITALFAFNDMMAMGAIDFLQSQGIRVPDDVSVTGFDNISQSASCDPPLTTVDQFPYEGGQRTARLLFDLIAGRGLIISPLVYPTKLVVRQSTARARTQ